MERRLPDARAPSFARGVPVVPTRALVGLVPARVAAELERTYLPLQRSTLRPRAFAGGVARNRTHLALAFEMAVPSVSVLVIEDGAALLGAR